jgi:uncharacterized RDD family membrane protein YckC
MRKLLEILTPENVYVEYELAGLGSRFAAMLLDTLIQAALLAIAVIAAVTAGLDFTDITRYDSAVFAVSIVVVFIIWFGYFIFFEMVTNGQTPGKMAVKLRVIRQNGEPIVFFDSFLRNILRLVNAIPALYIVDALFILFTHIFIL